MFHNPWALFFLTAVGAPVVVHFLTRPKPVVLPISTLRFVREVIQQRRARHWLRDLLLLLLRMTAVALIVFAIARPRAGNQPLVTNEQDDDAVRVVIVDVSQSLAAVEGGSSLFERARVAAAEHLRYRQNLRANLILAGVRPRAVFEQPSQNFNALRDELARAQPRPEALDVRQAFAAAAEMLAPRDPDDQRPRELVIVSDFQRSNWTQADFSVLPQRTKIQLESVAPKQRLANLAIAAARVSVNSVDQATGRVEVDVGNWSATSQKIEVEVQIGSSNRRLSGDCPPGRQTTLSDEFVLSTLGWHVGSARLIAATDALASDDELPIVAEVRSRPTYLLVTRQPATLRPSSSHFLECALAPENAVAEGKKSQVVRSTPDKLDSELLSNADLIAIDHPGTLNEPTIQALAGAMRRGRPVLYVAAETADATNLQRLSVELGRGLRMPVAFQPPPVGQVRRDLFLTSVKYDTPPFAAFGEGAAGFVRGLRFAGGLASRRVPETLADDVLATYNDGSACLVFTLADTTSFAVLNADLGTSNLPTHAAFVPLIDQLSQQLMERRSLITKAHPGQSLVIRVPLSGATAGSLKVVVPQTGGDATALGELKDEAAGVNWHWPVVGGPGIYQLRQGSNTVFALAVSAPAEESQLEPISPDVLQKRLASSREIYFRNSSEESQPRDPWWTWLTVGCLLCLFGELGTLLVFRT